MRTTEIVTNSKNISTTPLLTEQSHIVSDNGFPEGGLERNWQRCHKTAESFLDYVLCEFNLDRAKCVNTDKRVTDRGCSTFKENAKLEFQLYMI